MDLPKVPENIFDSNKENLEKLLRLFPDVLKDGQLDLDVIKEAIGNFEELDKEKYGLQWPGKQKAKQIANQQIRGLTLKLNDAEKNSYENLYIEGENLKVLKLLLHNYYESIKMIYIDPPYNTGKDFIYNDDYKVTQTEYDKLTGDISEEGRLILNQKGNGRFHSVWLNMMYSRLLIARDLLSEDGVIFISINDIEVANLKLICNEIFGENNFLAQMVWNSEGNTDNQLEIKIKHEYVLVYLKNSTYKDEAIGYIVDPNTKEDSNLFKGYADNNITKNNPANPPIMIELPRDFPADVEELYIKAEDLNEEFFTITKKEKVISKEIKETYNIKDLPVKVDEMVIRDYKLIQSCRIYSGVANAEKLRSFIKNNCEPIDDDGQLLTFYINRNGCVRYRKEREKARNILSVLSNLGTTEKMKSELKRIDINFDYPKPVNLIKYLVQIGADKENAIVLDFFSGSGTTAHATMLANSEDNLQRKYILVQVPDNEICELSKKRIKINEQQLKEQNKLENVAFGFKNFILSETNIRWTHEALNEGQISASEVEMTDKDKLDFMPDTKDIDVVYEIMLRQRDVPLSSSVELLSHIGERTYMFADSYVVCLEEDITPELVEKLAAIDPLPIKYVLRDSAFGENISLKEETFRRLQLLVERNTGVSKKTYTVEFL